MSDFNEIRERELTLSKSKVVFQRGSFDDYCVYVINSSTKVAPLDLDYFKFMKYLADKVGSEIVYRYFVDIYEKTSKIVVSEVLDLIVEQAKSLCVSERDAMIYEGYMTVIYFAMVAEENKANTKLGKRIKRLGMYELIMLEKPPHIAANSSRGVRWRDLDKKMVEYGF